MKIVLLDLSPKNSLVVRIIAKCLGHEIVDCPLEPVQNACMPQEVLVCNEKTEEELQEAKAKGVAEFLANMTNLVWKAIEGSENDSIILPLFDRSSVVSAAITQKLTSDHVFLRSPSMESLAVAIYKPLMYKLLLNGDDAVPFKVISLTKWDYMNKSLELKQACADEACAQVGLPAFIKPSNGDGSFCISRINTSNELIAFLDQQSLLAKMDATVIALWNEWWIGFELFNQTVPKLLDLNRELLQHPSFLLVPFVDTPVKVISDFLAWNGELILWAMVDDIYFDENPEVFVGCYYPSPLPTSIQTKIIVKARRILGKLMNAYGYNNQFFHIEWMVRPNPKKPDGVDLIVMEINARLMAMFEPSYIRCLENCASEVFMKLASLKCKDVIPQSPKPKTWPDGSQVHALAGYITLLKGGLLDDLVDFDKVEQMVAKNKEALESGSTDPVVFTVVHRGENIPVTGSSGITVGFVHVIGKSFEECFDQYRAVSKQFVKDIKATPLGHTSEYTTEDAVALLFRDRLSTLKQLSNLS